MNTYYKYCPNVWLAKSDEELKHGDDIILTNKYSKETTCIVYKKVKSKTTEKPFNLYSFERKGPSYAERKAERYKSWQASAERKADKYYEASNKDSDFLSLGEPVKVGHHSERKHRKIIEQAQNNATKSCEFSAKAENYESKIGYWEHKAAEINLSMPESLEYFKCKLEQAKQIHLEYKTGVRQAEHSYSVTYAKKEVNELEKKIKVAKLLWEL